MGEKTKYLLMSSTLAAVLGVGVMLLPMFSVSVHPHSYYLLAYHWSISLLSFLIYTKGVGTKDGLRFYNHSMGAVSLRLFSSAILLLIYYMYVKVALVNFTVTFFVIYFCFSVFEITVLLHNLRANSVYEH